MKQQRQITADQQSVSNPQPRRALAIYGTISPVFNRKSSLVCNSNRLEGVNNHRGPDYVNFAFNANINYQRFICDRLG